MKCPRCEDSVLDEKDRDGVTLDVCRVCRGLWLDRGELEKLIARTTREFDEYARRRDRDDDDDDDDDDDREERRRRSMPPQGQVPTYPQGQGHGYPPPHPHHHPPRKRSWFENLGEIFD